MKINVEIDTNDNNVQITDGKVLRDYDGRVLRSDEVLVAMDLGDDFIEVNVTNPDSIKTIKVGNSIRKAVFVAVPKEYETEAKRQLYFLQNEDNGKYRTKGEVSADALQEEYSIETPDLFADIEYIVEEMLSREYATSMFEERFTELLNTSPRHAYALLLIMRGVKGKEFMEMMKLGHECANVIKKEAEYLYSKGLENLDFSRYKSNRTKNTDYYYEAAEKALDHILDFLA